MTDRVWAELNARPVKPCRWGAAVDARDSIPQVPLIAEPTLRMTRKELRSPACPVCGNSGNTHCACDDAALTYVERISPTRVAL
jgi:hypothetical protein